MDSTKALPLGDCVFKADYIKKERRRKGKREFLIKWKGYSSKQCTWEPEENILDPLLIKEYKGRRQYARRMGRRRGSEAENVRPRSNSRLYHPYDLEKQLSDSHNPHLSIVTNYKRQQNAMLHSAKLKGELNHSYERDGTGAGTTDVLTPSGNGGSIVDDMRSIFHKDSFRSTNNSLSSHLDLMCATCNNKEDAIETEKIRVPRTCVCEDTARKDRNFFDWVSQTHHDFHPDDLHDHEHCGSFITPKDEHEHVHLRYRSDSDVTSNSAFSPKPASHHADHLGEEEGEEEQEIAGPSANLHDAEDEGHFEMDDVDDEEERDEGKTAIRESTSMACDDFEENPYADEDINLDSDIEESSFAPSRVEQKSSDAEFVVTNVTCNDITVTFVECSSKDGFFKEGYESTAR